MVSILTLARLLTQALRKGGGWQPTAQRSNMAYGHGALVALSGWGLWQ